MIPLHGKVALVTGATQGLGADIAASLRAAGASVMITGRDIQRGTAVAEALGADAVFVNADLAQDDGIALSPALGRTAYRVVQEALTNVRKHAPGAQVSVRLSRLDGLIRVSVHNTASPGTPVRESLPMGSGMGLLGLRQRVELVGGGFDATGTPGGICTVAISASKPDRGELSIGMPITGKAVTAAAVPARCAAPPAPAMISFNPRSFAEATYSWVRRGDR